VHTDHGWDEEGVMGVGKDLWTEWETRYNKHDFPGAASIWASDAVYTDPNGRCEGGKAIQAYHEAADKPFSDISLETTLLIEEGDTAVAEWRWRATHTAAIAIPDGNEIPPTGKTIEISAVSVMTVRDGKVALQRAYFDTAAMMSQLGLMPGA
jgi:steroid delta-isomerase-like uncharacterized protein